MIPTYPHPGYGKPYPVTTVLRDLAAQEGCDGEPYDVMIEAARLIDGYEEMAKHSRDLVRQLDVAMHGEQGAAKQATLCDLIGPAQELRERAEAAEKLVEALQKRHRRHLILGAAVRERAEKAEAEIERLRAMMGA